MMVTAGLNSERGYRIGDVAEAVGVTPRTIRYYEELGLLGDPEQVAQRVKGSHRLFSQADVDRLRELVRLRDLLGLSLEELTQLAEAAQVQYCLRSRWAASTADSERARILHAAIPHVQRQLDLVHARQHQLADFAAELDAKLQRLHTLLGELEAAPAAAR
jgi:MerR family transcriptional regulator, repressor of the yfmOP operon